MRTNRDITSHFLGATLDFWRSAPREAGACSRTWKGMFFENKS